MWCVIQTGILLWCALINVYPINDLLASIGASGLQISNAQFVNKPLCNVTERIAMSCMVPFEFSGGLVDSQHTRSSNSTGSSETPASVDLLLCAIECMHDGSCVGCSRNSSAATQAQTQWLFYKHWPCDRVFPVCGDGDEGFDYMERTNACQNGGVWDETVKRCSCANTEEYVGEFCQRRAQNCAEFEASGYSVGYQHRNLRFPGDETDALVLCWLYGQWYNDAMMTLYRRPETRYNSQGVWVYDTVKYNMTWAQQEAGYWDLDTINGWVGLRNLAQILRYNNPVTLKLRINVGDSQFEQDYFDLDLAEETYALTYASVSLNRKKGTEPVEIPGICFPEALKGTNFSTWDRDNDYDPEMNCAAEAGGGWWYQSCDETCNFFLTGYSAQNPEPESYSRIRVTGLDIRAWADTFGPVSLTIHNILE